MFLCLICTSSVCSIVIKMKNRLYQYTYLRFRDKYVTKSLSKCQAVKLVHCIRWLFLRVRPDSHNNTNIQLKIMCMIINLMVHGFITSSICVCFCFHPFDEHHTYSQQRVFWFVDFVYETFHLHWSIFLFVVWMLVDWFRHAHSYCSLLSFRFVHYTWNYH